MKITDIEKISEQTVNEVSMAPSDLERFATSDVAKAMQMGFEAEIVVDDLGASDGDSESEPEPDYDMDERVTSNASILDFFVGSYNSRRDVERAIESIDEEFFEYADSQMYDDFLTDAVDKIKEVLSDEGHSPDEINDIMDSDGKEYYDAKDKAWENYREDPDYDQYVTKFFRMNYPYMSNIASGFNLDWPHWTDGESSDDDAILTVKQLANDIGDALGYPTRANDSYHGGRPAGTFVLEPDSSIRAGSGQGGIEVISPPLPLESALIALEDFFDWAEKYPHKVYVGPEYQTGMHIGLSIPQQTRSNVDHLKLMLFLGDEHVLKTFNRENSTWTRSILKKIKSTLRNRADSEDWLERMKAFKGGFDSAAARATQRMIMPAQSDRYLSLNIKDNYVEMRSPGGDYINKRKEIRQTVLRYVRAMAIASDPKAETKEYATKLYKLLSEASEDAVELQDVTKIFSRVAAGSMSPDMLKLLLKQRKSDREKIKKPEQPSDASSFTFVTKNRGSYVSITAATPAAAIRRAGDMYLAADSRNRMNLADFYGMVMVMPDGQRLYKLNIQRDSEEFGTLVVAGSSDLARQQLAARWHLTPEQAQAFHTYDVTEQNMENLRHHLNDMMDRAPPSWIRPGAAPAAAPAAPAAQTTAPALGPEHDYRIVNNFGGIIGFVNAADDDQAEEQAMALARSRRIPLNNWTLLDPRNRIVITQPPPADTHFQIVRAQDNWRIHDFMARDIAHAHQMARAWLTSQGLSPERYTVIQGPTQESTQPRTRRGVTEEARKRR